MDDAAPKFWSVSFIDGFQNRRMSTFLSLFLVAFVGLILFGVFLKRDFQKPVRVSPPIKTRMASSNMDLTSPSTAETASFVTATGVSSASVNTAGIADSHPEADHKFPKPSKESIKWWMKTLDKCKLSAVSSGVKASLEHAEDLRKGNIKSYTQKVGASTAISTGLSAIVSIWNKAVLPLLGINIGNACLVGEDASFRECTLVVGNIGAAGLLGRIVRPVDTSGAVLYGVARFAAEYFLLVVLDSLALLTSEAEMELGLPSLEHFGEDVTH